MEAMRCSQVSAVLASIGGLDLTESRRLQLAAETSGATGFLFGHAASAPIAAPISRWKISSPSEKLPQRFDQPVWSLDLLYCRGGRPGNWTLEWNEGQLSTLSTPQMAAQEALAG
jgi:protein ImuA